MKKMKKIFPLALDILNGKSLSLSEEKVRNSCFFFCVLLRNIAFAIFHHNKHIDYRSVCTFVAFLIMTAIKK